MTDYRTESMGGAGSRAHTNEHVTLDALNPAGATTAKFRFSYLDGGNDWWWAIDNVKASGRTANAGANLTAQIVTPMNASQGTVSLNANGGFTYTPAAGFTGVATFTYRTNDAVNNSAPATVSILVGPKVAVQVNDGSVQRSRVTSLQVTFAGIVTFGTTQPGQAFTLTKDVGGTPTAVPFNVTSIDYSTGATIVTISAFSGTLTDFGSLSDGRYTLTTLASQVSINGQPLASDVAFQFFRFFGDSSGDANVNGLDLSFFRNAFGSSAGDANFLSYFDFNGDGVINGLDLGQFRTRFGSTLP
jgi:hypothetical protein